MTRIVLLGAAALAAALLLWQGATYVVAALNSQSGSTANRAARVATPQPPFDGDLGSLSFSTAGWRTDFGRSTVNLREIRSGGPPRDGIPPIDRPRFQSVGEVDWLKDVEPVVAVLHGGEARAYPLQILIWHEIVNDAVGGTPVAVTFCPLCNIAIVFQRDIQGQGTARFGTTGNLRHSDLVMWDDLTESWWQQATGEAIVGELAGTVLARLPAQIVGFGEFRAAHPSGQVLTRDTGHSRDYGRNPYVGYDDVNSSPFLFSGPTDGRLRPMERVVAVSLGDETVAYPLTALAERRVIEDVVGGRSIVVWHQPGTASALDESSIAESRDVGAVGVFDSHLDGRPLTFASREDGFADRETGSTWDIFGRAVGGPLAGSRLKPIAHGNHFWFAWAVFQPETRVWQEGG